MPTNSYDLIVVGDDLAGLVAAALCVRAGLRTLVLAQHERPTRYTVGPHRLPVEPQVLAGRGGGAIQRVVKDLHLDHVLKRRLREPRLGAQLVGPDVRIDVSADSHALARELERELGEQGAAALAAWDRGCDVSRLADPLLIGEYAFPGVGFWERREVARLAARAEAEAEVWWTRAASALASGPTLALFSLPAALGTYVAAPSPLARARALDAWRAGVAGTRGDSEGLRDLLIDKVTTGSGELRTARVTELVTGWGKVSAVRLASGEELGARQVIAALPVRDLVSMLGKKPPRRLVELDEQVSVAGWLYTLNLVVDVGGVPEGMAPAVLAMRDPDAPPSGDNAFAIHVGDSDDAGRVVVTISAVLPSPPDGAAVAQPLETWMEPALAALRRGLLDAVEMVMPFLASHVMVVHSPHQSVAPEVPGGHGSHEAPRFLPLPPRPLWRGELEHSAAVGAVPYTTGIKNLTIASAQVLPHLGLEGELAAGRSASKIACAIAGKKKDYLRDEVLTAG